MKGVGVHAYFAFYGRPAKEGSLKKLTTKIQHCSSRFNVRAYLLLVANWFGQTTYAFVLNNGAATSSPQQVKKRSQLGCVNEKSCEARLCVIH